MTGIRAQYEFSVLNHEGRIREYARQSLSENSRKALTGDLRHFTDWGGNIPANPETISRYISDHAEVHSIATIKRRLASISKAHNMSGYDNPVSSELVKMVMRGVQRQHGKPQRQAAPILKEDLTVMLSHTPDNLKGQRDKALLILGFCAALRRSELVGIQAQDLEFNAQGLILTITRSKTDASGTGEKIAIPYGRGKICPVKLVCLWLENSGIENGPLFVSFRKGNIPTGERLSDRAVSDIIKHYAAKAGLNPERHSGHSLRSGLATSAAMHGVSSWKIRAQTRHKSDAMLARYIRDGDMFTDNAAGSLF